MAAKVGNAVLLSSEHYSGYNHEMEGGAIQ